MQTKRTTQGRILTAEETLQAVEKAKILFDEWLAKQEKPIDIFCACLSGSHAYGFATDKSDVDIRGIWVADSSRFFTLSPLTFRKKNATILLHGDEMDIEMQELGKFLVLALKNNPNILDTLFVSPELVLQADDKYWELREAMPILLNRKHILNAYSGYALQQFSRMKQQYTDTKTTEESIAVFTDEEYKAKLIEMRKRHPRNDWDHLLQRNITIDVPVPVSDAERVLNVKNAAHLLRLLAVGEHILRTGEFLVVPPNKDFIVEVRTGNVSWDDIISERNRLEQKMEEAYQSSTVNNDESASRKWADEFLFKIRKSRFLEE